MKIVKLKDRKLCAGYKVPGISRTERLGYVPTEQRIARLLSAGLLLRRIKDEYFDSFSDDDLPAPPPIARHFQPDMAEISELAKEYHARRTAIELRLSNMDPEKVAQYRQKHGMIKDFSPQIENEGNPKEPKREEAKKPEA